MSTTRLDGRSIGGLSGRKLTFRPQLFWQEVLPEHAVADPGSLQFECNMSTGRNYCRVPSARDVAADGAYARSVARCIADAECPCGEEALVARALREAATFAGDAAPLQHLLSSTYCTRAALQGALQEACRANHVGGVELLLHANADIRAQPGGKTALHVACEQGCEEAARALVRADADALRVASALDGRTPLEVARDLDFGSMARRLVALSCAATSAPGAAPPSATPSATPSDAPSTTPSGAPTASATGAAPAPASSTGAHGSEGAEWDALLVSAARCLGRGEQMCAAEGLPPLLDLVVDDACVRDESNALELWRLAARHGDAAFPLQMALAAAMLRALLLQNKYLRDDRFCRWPSRDRHQLWATLWLALRLLPERPYTPTEVDEIVRAHLTEPSPSLVHAVTSELHRRQLLLTDGVAAESPATATSTDDGANGGSRGDVALASDDTGASVDSAADVATSEGGRRHGGSCCRLSRQQVEFLLDGDKLFSVRAAVASSRPWWALPVAAQHLAAPRCAVKGHAEGSGAGGEAFAFRRFRCVLLEPRDGEARGEEAVGEEAAGHAPCGPSGRFTIKFVPAGSTTGGEIIDARGGVVVVECGAASDSTCADGASSTGAESNGQPRHTFASFEGTFPAPTVCMEARVAAADANGDVGHGRVPPFRIDGWDDSSGEWVMLHCQPMPSGEEALNQGRDACRAFLPGAVPLLPPPAADDGRTRRLHELVDAAGLLITWPRKQKQQAQASLWLALRLIPGRVYTEAELDWLIDTCHSPAKVPDHPTIRKELERCGLVERQPGGGGVRALPDAIQRELNALARS